MAHKIIHDWHTECSACGGNADMNESSHIHGGPDPGGSMGPQNLRSAISETNGCRAVFDEPNRPSDDARFDFSKLEAK